MLELHSSVFNLDKTAEYFRPSLCYNLFLFNSSRVIVNKFCKADLNLRDAVTNGLKSFSTRPIQNAFVVKHGAL